MAVGAREPGVDRVFVDGMNLYLRCHRASVGGLLKDARGRSTGALYSFLWALAGMRKRWSKALVTVAWDGSNEARRARFAGYKATRAAEVRRAGWSEVEWLRGTLCWCGVAQAGCLAWEADDVIATLVARGEAGMAAGPVVRIVSTDRDYLQLMGERVALVVPAPRPGCAERVYDAARVKREWGVGPGDIVTLRALVGDDSDDLPGIVRVQRKFLARLVAEHGGLDAIFALEMKKWTKTRRENLRAHEVQARLNLELMELRRDVNVLVVEGLRDEEAFRRRLEGVSVQTGRLAHAFFGEARVESGPRQGSLFE